MQQPKGKSGYSRRQFLCRALGAATAATIVPGRLVFGEATPSKMINLAVIGAGGRGADNILEIRAKNLANIVALCDVDDARAAKTYALLPDLPRYKDFRRLLDKEQNIDAVLVATPDHNHVHATLAAIQLGKHVYCEKPLTHTIEEARAVANAARAKGVATQMGNQGMAFEGNRLLNEWIDAGLIGAVHEVHAWSDRPTHGGKLMWPQGMARPTETPPVPATLDWDRWLGPAPERAYHPAYLPFVWRGWWDFGSGAIGDMGIHNLAPVFSALRLGLPLSASAHATLFNDDSLPLASTVHFRFAARTVDLGSANHTGYPSYPRPSTGAQTVDMPPVDLHWYDGGILPPRPSELMANEELNPEDGVLFVGDQGKILVDGWGGNAPRLLLPDAPSSGAIERSLHATADIPKRLPRSIGHHAEWIEACKGAAPARSNFDFAGPLTEAVLLGAVAIRTGKHLAWNPDTLEATNAPEARQYIRKQYRKGWELSSPG